MLTTTMFKTLILPFTLPSSPDPTCVIEDALRISPFNASLSYQFRGTCELIALQSCNGSRPDFAVRVDYLSDNFGVGAVGVFKDGFRWVVREDRSFFTTSSEVAVVVGNVSTYVASDVAVTREGDVVRLAVGDEIGVTVTRSFAGESNSGEAKNTVHIARGSLHPLPLELFFFF